MKLTIPKSFLICLLTWSAGFVSAQSKNRAVDFWLTNIDQSALFTRQKPTIQFSPGAPSGKVIKVDESETFQPIDGFGFTLTGGSASHLIAMSKPARAALLKELFATTGSNIEFPTSASVSVRLI